MSGVLNREGQNAARCGNILRAAVLQVADPIIHCTSEAIAVQISSPATPLLRRMEGQGWGGKRESLEQVTGVPRTEVDESYTELMAGILPVHSEQRCCDGWDPIGALWLWNPCIVQQDAHRGHCT